MVGLLRAVFPAAHEVGVEVGFDDIADRKAARFGLEVDVHVAPGVDDRRLRRKPRR